MPAHDTEVAAPRSVADLKRLVGETLGPAEWYEVSQERIDSFAAVTGDDQWIHVDVERSLSGPLGTTIAHGLFTLSLGPQFMMQLIAFDGFSRALNYGYAKVRFPSALPSGKRLRMRASVVSVEDVPGGAHVAIEQIFEAEGVDKPVCVATSLARFYESV